MTVASDNNFALPTVVYIEDDDLCAELVKDGLGKRCRILRASDGLAGLELVERILPALVLVDLHIAPGGSHSPDGGSQIAAQGRRPNVA